MVSSVVATDECQSTSTPKMEFAEGVRQATSILNRIAPDNMERLAVELKEILRADGPIVREIVRRIFLKAVLEPKYCKLYTELCYLLFKQDAPTERFTEFRGHLLDLCQDEFQKRNELNSRQISEDEAQLHRVRMRGNMEFLGEIYKRQFISSKIITLCFDTLLPPRDSTDLEVFCRLMATVGPRYEADREGAKLNGYFKQAEALSTDPSIESRIRFLLRDLCDLRSARWQPRFDRPEATSKKQEGSVSGRGVQIPRGENDRAKKMQRMKKSGRAHHRPSDRPHARKQFRSTDVKKKRKNQLRVGSPNRLFDQARAMAQVVDNDSEARIDYLTPEQIKNLWRATLEEFEAQGCMKEMSASVQEILEDCQNPDVQQVNLIRLALKYISQQSTFPQPLVDALRILHDKNLLKPMEEGLHAAIRDLDDLAEEYPKSPALLGTAAGELYDLLSARTTGLRLALESITSVAAGALFVEAFQERVTQKVEGDPTSQFPSKYRNYSQATELKQLLRTESPELCYEWAKENIDEKMRKDPIFIQLVLGFLTRQIPLACFRPDPAKKDIEIERSVFGAHNPLLVYLADSTLAKQEFIISSFQNESQQQRVATYFPNFAVESGEV